MPEINLPFFGSQRSLGLSVLIIYVVLILIRVPEIIWPGRFWAEEGTIYFREAYTHMPWDVVTTTNQGYYSLFNKLASIAAVHTVPLRFAPVITMLFALAVQILPVVLLLFSQLRSLASRFSQICAVVLVLLVQPNQEVWLNTTNSQFFLCISTAIILISEPTKRLTHIVRLGILALAGLTGVASCLLLPFFWIEYAWTRNKHKLHEAIVLASVCAIQGAIVMSGPGRDTRWDLSLLAFTLVSKQWVLPLLGSSAADSFAAYVEQYRLFKTPLLALAALLPHAALGSGLVLWGRRHSWLLFAASVSIASISFLKSVEQQSTDWILAHLSAFGGGRYYYVPNVLLALALVMPLKQNAFWGARYSRYFHLGCLALVGLIVIVGADDFIGGKERHEWCFDGPSWQAEVRNWQENRAGVLYIWPRSWSMELPQDERIAEPDAAPDANKPRR